MKKMFYTIVTGLVVYTTLYAAEIEEKTVVPLSWSVVSKGNEKAVVVIYFKYFAASGLAFFATMDNCDVKTAAKIGAYLDWAIRKENNVTVMIDRVNEDLYAVKMKENCTDTVLPTPKKADRSAK